MMTMFCWFWESVCISCFASVVLLVRVRLHWTLRLLWAPYPRRINKRADGILIPTPLLILTFELLSLPNEISAAWHKIKVKPFIPSPMRCFYRQIFGHTNKSCRRRIRNEKEICVNCAGEEHGTCSKTPNCMNCKGPHPASSKT